MAVTVNDFLTKDEINRAKKIYKELGIKGGFAKKCADEIITPNIERINKKLGQENVPLYLAYAVEYVFLKQTERC
jgi:hypothetical protein